MESEIYKDFVIDKPGTVVVLATGGTIAGVGEKGKSTVYESGLVSADELLSEIPQIRDIANIRAFQFCNLNSDDITSEHWLSLVRLINRLAADPNVKGFVITHGTDTMEETAYFINLTAKTSKPIVLTGSMRPSTAFSADGPMNLYQAICVAADPRSVGRGVMLVFSDIIYSARSVVKASTYSVTAMSGGTFGAMGMIRDGELYFYEGTVKAHTLGSEFDVSKLTKLPRVAIVYSYTDADTGLFRYAAENFDGIVLAGAGAGEYSLKLKAEIERTKVPVVISSRIGEVMITQKMLICPSTIAANNLQPQKAALLLRLALTVTKNKAELIRIFSEY